LTQQGNALLVNAPEVAQGLLVRGLEALTEEKLNMLDEGLCELTKILGAQELPPQLILSSEVNAPGKRSTKSRI
jgi:hypothetical protein